MKPKIGMSVFMITAHYSTTGQVIEDKSYVVEGDIIDVIPANSIPSTEQAQYFPEYYRQKQCKPCSLDRFILKRLDDSISVVPFTKETEWSILERG